MLCEVLREEGVSAVGVALDLVGEAGLRVGEASEGETGRDALRCVRGREEGGLGWGVPRRREVSHGLVFARVRERRERVEPSVRGGACVCGEGN